MEREREDMEYGGGGVVGYEFPAAPIHPSSPPPRADLDGEGGKGGVAGCLPFFLLFFSFCLQCCVFFTCVSVLVSKVGFVVFSLLLLLS